MPTLVSSFHYLPFVALLVVCRGVSQAKLRVVQPTPRRARSTSSHLMHVAYSSDNRTFPSLLVSMLSLARGLARPSDCIVHLIVPEADLHIATQLVNCFRNELLTQQNAKSALTNIPEVMVHRMKPQRRDQGLQQNAAAPEWTKRFLTTPAAYVRLHLTEYMPNGVSKVLWLDTDTVVQGDIGPLFLRRMAHTIAAAYDKKSFAAAYPEWTKGANKILPSGFTAQMLVFNSGVMLFDLRKWKEQGVEHSLQEKMALIPDADDQFLLNMVFYQSFDVLGNEWNQIGLGEPSSWWEGVDRPSAIELQAAQVLHWTGRCKPFAASDDSGADSRNGCKSEYQHVYDQYQVRLPCYFRSGSHMIQTAGTCAPRAMNRLVDPPYAVRSSNI